MIRNKIRVKGSLTLSRNREQTESSSSGPPAVTSPTESTTSAPSHSSDPAGLRPTLIAGVAVVGIFFGGLGGWAGLAPLNSAAMAPGTVIVQTNRKAVQLLEGGIVGEILVKDGDRVRAGQGLLRLDQTPPRANLELLMGRKMTAAALEARLIAERDNKPKVIFPRWLADNPSQKGSEIMAGERSVFASRREAMSGQIAVLRWRNAQFSEETRGLKGQIKAEERQLSLIREELKEVRSLLKAGMALKERVLSIEREKSNLEGSRSQNIAAVARNRQSIVETRLRVIELKAIFDNQVTKELREIQSELFELDERIIAAQDIPARLEIKAPIDGVVMGSRVHTIGGILAPGETILEIAPSPDRLIIEARVDPNDIDIVHEGLAAQVKFSASSQRYSLPVEGIVLSVSAEHLTDETTGESFYLAKIVVSDEALNALEGKLIIPGMQAEVMIVTGERTALDYFLSPITQSLGRAFREI